MKKTGVIVSNLGTPDSSSPKDVARYLRDFLMDPYVITIPWFFRFLLVQGIIAPFRSKKSAKNYQKIWTEKGSPLRFHTEQIVNDLQKKLGESYKVVPAMRYGKPSFEEAREKLKDCSDVILFQQYPQFADSTTTTGEEHFKKVFSGFNFKIIEPYYKSNLFISSYVGFLKEEFKKIDFDYVLMSFHGLPESHLKSADPLGNHCLQSKNCCEKSEKVLSRCYRAQCFSTAKALAEGLGLKDNYRVSFQSRLGRQKWIEPYTEDMYKELASQGVKKLAVICPGFSVDGLETLEEIALGGKESFLAQGGDSFHFVPCLNSDPGWVMACAQMILET